MASEAVLFSHLGDLADLLNAAGRIPFAESLGQQDAVHNWTKVQWPLWDGSALGGLARLTTGEHFRSSSSCRWPARLLDQSPISTGTQSDVIENSREVHRLLMLRAMTPHRDRRKELVESRGMQANLFKVG
jgi:hypothetical protein